MTRPIKIAIAALGGQGGGVLADWIVASGEKAGFLAQSTSVPGVAQRTGATVYYIELFPEGAAKARGITPVLALMPTPGDVDIVIASELMEAGRAILRGFVSNETTLIASSHRDYAIAEKITLGDGRRDGGAVIDAAAAQAGRLIIADMAEAARDAGAPLSAVLFGALAGSGALPISKAAFEQTIRDGRSVDANLAGFARGFEIGAASPLPHGGRGVGGEGPPTGAALVDARSPPAPLSQAGEGSARGAVREKPLPPKLRQLLDRLSAFPLETHTLLTEGLRRVVDYQGTRYGGLYLDRMEEMRGSDTGPSSRLLSETAKYLALRMTWEDAIRVADLKTRTSRFERFRQDVKAADGQIVHVSEYLHPRVEEVCDLLPPSIARFILSSPRRRKLLSGLIGGGRRMSTTKLRGFLPLYVIAMLRPFRRATYRFAVETQRISDWLALLKAEAARDYDLACEIATLPRLIKGYGETHQRGLANFDRIVAALPLVKESATPVAAFVALKAAALKDENGAALGASLRALSQSVAA